MIKRPMRAATFPLRENSLEGQVKLLKTALSLHKSLFVSPKIDGIRAYVEGGILYSNSNKPIANPVLQEKFAKTYIYDGLDGELVCGTPTAPGAFRRTSSVVLSQKATGEESEVHFHIFDLIDSPAYFFASRKTALDILWQEVLIKNEFFRLVSHLEVKTPTHLFELFDQALETGYEGIMVRGGLGLYKYGRSTLKEFSLVKFKEFSDAEATIVGISCLEQNNNNPFTNEMGMQVRSSSQEGKTQLPKVGAFLVEDKLGRRFSIGTGFTEEERVDFYRRSEELIGQSVVYKFFDQGDYDLPRHPVFLRLRPTFDIAEGV